ncbi:MAG TPA: hypothetical protein VGK00_13230 [Anaerolineales bacterium]|jgi:hypothetical protein
MRSSFHQVRLVIVLLAVAAGLALAVSFAAAQGTTASDLEIKLVSIPKHAKACETFEAVYTITNLGPQDVTNVNLWMSIPDPLGTLEIQGTPANLAVGESVTVKAIVKVVAFVPGESRYWWINGFVRSDAYPDINVDPNPTNDEAPGTIKLISKHATLCP